MQRFIASGYIHELLMVCRGCRGEAPNILNFIIECKVYGWRHNVSGIFLSNFHATRQHDFYYESPHTIL